MPDSLRVEGFGRGRCDIIVCAQMPDQVRSRSSQHEKLSKSPSVQQAGVKVPLLFDTMGLKQEVRVHRRPSHADAHLKAGHLFDERKISGRGSGDGVKTPFY